MRLNFHTVCPRLPFRKKKIERILMGFFLSVFFIPQKIGSNESPVYLQEECSGKNIVSQRKKINNGL